MKRKTFVEVLELLVSAIKKDTDVTPGEHYKGVLYLFESGESLLYEDSCKLLNRCDTVEELVDYFEEMECVSFDEDESNEDELTVEDPHKYDLEYVRNNPGWYQNEGTFNDWCLPYISNGKSIFIFNGSDEPEEISYDGQTNLLFRKIETPFETPFETPSTHSSPVNQEENTKRIFTDPGTEFDLSVYDILKEDGVYESTSYPLDWEDAESEDKNDAFYVRDGKFYLYEDNFLQNIEASLEPWSDYSFRKIGELYA